MKPEQFERLFSAEKTNKIHKRTAEERVAGMDILDPAQVIERVLTKHYVGWKTLAPEQVAKMMPSVVETVLATFKNAARAALEAQLAKLSPEKLMEEARERMQYIIDFYTPKPLRKFRENGKESMWEIYGRKFRILHKKPHTTIEVCTWADVISIHVGDKRIGHKVQDDDESDILVVNEEDIRPALSGKHPQPLSIVAAFHGF